MKTIDVKTLDDTAPGMTATEMLMHSRIMTRHAAEVIGKINEIVECINKHGCDGKNDDTWEV